MPKKPFNIIVVQHKDGSVSRIEVYPKDRLQACAELTESVDSLSAAVFAWRESFAEMARVSTKLSRITERLVQERLESAAAEARRINFAVQLRER